MRTRLCVLAALCTLALCLSGTSLGATARQATGTKVTVTFTDSRFSLSNASLEAGSTTFVVVNRGAKKHAFAIDGPGIHGVQTPKLTAGQRASFTVTLRAGAYVLSDPVGLSPYNVQFLDIVPASTVTATGDSSVVQTPPTASQMCGTQYLTSP
jgi:iron uptake system component EfeO